MAFTYLIVNCVFMLIVSAVLFRYRKAPSRSWWVTLGALLALTMVFDNVIIGLGIVAYDTAKISQLYIGIAPIEDFFYAVLAVVLVPTLWRIVPENKKEVPHA